MQKKIRSQIYKTHRQHIRHDSNHRLVISRAKRINKPWIKNNKRSKTVLK